MKIRTLAGNEGPFSHAFFCEGCGTHHGFNVDNTKKGPCWTWNGSVDSPTIQPSLLVRSGNENGPTVCHSFVTDGQIQYLSDSTHHLSGQTVELTDV